MTPQDRCERMRDIVFEIIKRRYQETMPTRVEHKHGEFVIYLRDKLAAKFSIFREWPMFDPDRVSILCEAHSMHSPVRSGKNTDDFARFSAGVSYLYLDLYLARRARDLSQSDTVAQSLSEAIEGALAADEAKTIGAMLRAGRALRWIEKVAS